MKKILLIEDEKVIFSVIHSILVKYGYEVVRANDGIEAVYRMRMYNIDLIITDIMMPNLSGVELIDAYKKNIPEDTPVIVISRMDSYDIEYFVEAIGANAYYTKPFKVADLIKGVKALLDKNENLKLS